MAAIGTGLRRRIEAINQMNKLAFGGSNIVQNAHELRSGKVAHFTTPQGLHSLHGEVFKEQVITGRSTRAPA
jgi:hypothetical protein